MVQITQTDDEIKIVIELNRLITRKPDIVLLPTYIKYNNPPIFFERHLAQEVDELTSFCRIFKNEARIILMKKQKGIWNELFLKLSKEELMKKRLEIADLIVERNKERDRRAIERFDQKRRLEIEKEIKRETIMRERVKEFEKNACREMLMVDGKETQLKQKPDSRPGTAISRNMGRPSAPLPPSTPLSPPQRRQLASVRNSGKISVCFSNFTMTTPKRESTAHMKMPFTVSNVHDDNDDDDNNNNETNYDDPE